MPAARRAALKELAQAAAADANLFRPFGTIEESIARLRRIRGVGEWTAQYIAMRALAWPDAFPHTDLGVMKALDERRPQRVLAAAEAWRPWRAYAVMHLWRSLK
jgi:AraC family transcriptional regulator of adaptative response / DNA-3-methyladenine glycosylase II